MSSHLLLHLLLLFLTLLSLSSSLPELSSPWLSAMDGAENPPLSDDPNDEEDDKGPFVGVNIGTDVSNLLSPSDLVDFLKLQKIRHVRLYDADPALLAAMANTSIEVLLGIPNNQLLAIGSSNDTAAAWVRRNILAHHPATRISAVAVGDEVLTAAPSSAPLLLPAMESLHSAISAAGLAADVKVSTPHSAAVVVAPFPPSQAFFNLTLEPVLRPLVHFLNRTGSALMMNLYPYYVFMRNRPVVPLDNALFRPVTPAREEVDPNTLLHYTNVFDAMIDAAIFSMRNLNITGVPVVVSETGWPSKGDGRETNYATIDNAATYNSNLIRRVLGRVGTPARPEYTSSVYIYELFNEDLRPGPVSETRWGLFNGNGTPAYLLHAGATGGLLANDTTDRTFCVAANGVDDRTMQAALDWACGPGRANCSDIQPGETCYGPNTVKAHASYAFDSYYQMEGKVVGSCDFKGAAMITTTDPSHGNCIFPGSKKVANVTAKVPANVTDVNSSHQLVTFRIRWRWRSTDDLQLLFHFGLLAVAFVWCLQ